MEWWFARSLDRLLRQSREPASAMECSCLSGLGYDSHGCHGDDCCCHDQSSHPCRGYGPGGGSSVASHHRPLVPATRSGRAGKEAKINASRGDGGAGISAFWYAGRVAPTSG